MSGFFVFWQAGTCIRMRRQSLNLGESGFFLDQVEK